MAKQTTGCLLQRRLGNVSQGWMTLMLIALICFGNHLRAAEVASSNSPPSNVTTVPLEYQETANSIINWGVVLITQTTPFKKEPALAPGKTIRGVLNFGEQSTNSISFIWQCDAAKLYLDFNRNQDLSDDPSGVFSSNNRNSRYGTFSDVHLVFNSSSGRSQLRADIIFFNYGSSPSCDLALHSFWQGKVTLQGREWQVGIVQNVSNQSDFFENSRLLLRSWENRSKEFNTYNGSLDSVPFSPKLFVNGHSYQLKGLAWLQNGDAVPSLQFSEESAALGELKITGKYIQRLVMTGAAPGYLVLLDNPAGIVKIPTGSYSQSDILLEDKGVRAYCNSSQSSGGSRIAVSDKVPGVLDVGGPLTNSLIATRHGKELRFDYRLIGAGGQIYQLANQGRSPPPEFAVFKGGKKIASGKFEFG